jgi:hypothetical protein
VVVDEKVTYGKAISPQEFESIRNRKSFAREVVTYGVGERKDRIREYIEVKEEKGRDGCCGCGFEDRDTKKTLVQKYN